MDPRDTAIIHKDYPPCSTHRVRREGGEGPIWPLNWPGIRIVLSDSAYEICLRNRSDSLSAIINNGLPLSGKESGGGLMILISLLINLDSSFTLYDEFSLLIIVGGSARVG